MFEYISFLGLASLLVKIRESFPKKKIDYILDEYFYADI